MIILHKIGNFAFYSSHIFLSNQSSFKYFARFFVNIKILTFQELQKFCEKIILQKPNPISIFNFLVHPYLRNYYNPKIQLQVKEFCKTQCKSKKDCLTFAKVLGTLPKKMKKFDPNSLIH